MIFLPKIRKFYQEMRLVGRILYSRKVFDSDHIFVWFVLCTTDILSYWVFISVNLFLAFVITIIMSVTLHIIYHVSKPLQPQ